MLVIIKGFISIRSFVLRDDIFVHYADLLGSSPQSQNTNRDLRFSCSVRGTLKNL